MLYVLKAISQLTLMMLIKGQEPPLLVTLAKCLYHQTGPRLQFAEVHLEAQQLLDLLVLRSPL